MAELESGLWLVETMAEYHHVLDELNQSGPQYVAIDTETTGLSPYVVDEIRGISVATKDLAFYLPLTHPDSRNFEPFDLIAALGNHAFIFHHAVFDWAFLCQCKDDLEWWMGRTAWDTQVVNWMLDENLKVGLKPSCERIFGHDAGEEQRALKAIKGKSWDTYSAQDIGKYAAMDARLTYDLWQWQTDFLLHQDYITHNAIWRELDVQKCLARMIRTGIRVDPERVALGEAAMLERIDELNQGFATQGVNPTSPKDVGRWLYEERGWKCPLLTATGKPSTAIGALQLLELQGSQEAKALIEHRRLSKAVTAYFRPFSRLIGDDGRIHPHFSSTRTVTGRFACSNPNLQTIPKNKKLPEVRLCFSAEEGKELWEFDLSSAELRVIAGYAQEMEMIEALDTPGRDLHQETADRVGAIIGQTVSRDTAKNINYSFAYGVGPVTMAKYLAPVPTICDYWKSEKRRGRGCRACDTCTAADILDGYRKAYPKLTALLESCAKHAEREGWMPGIVEGRRRRFKGPGYRVPTYTAVNYIVQGGIGEFMKDVMRTWYAEQEDDWARMCLQVHDSFVIECDPGRGPDVQKALQGIADRLNPFYMRMIFDAKEWEKPEPIPEEQPWA